MQAEYLSLIKFSFRLMLLLHGMVHEGAFLGPIVRKDRSLKMGGGGGGAVGDKYQILNIV